ncbi:hypothetical protein Q5M85_07620 [Paraclostridium bifermentans]|nr:hypothetical protein [Paraclostridium bifermentans]
MVFKKKMALMSATAAITVMSMVGCSNSGGSSSGSGEAGDPYEVLANKMQEQLYLWL